MAFVVDAFSRSIMSWRASGLLRTCLALDALEQVSGISEYRTDKRAGRTRSGPRSARGRMPPMQFAMLQDALDLVEGPRGGYREKGHGVERNGKIPDSRLARPRKADRAGLHPRTLPWQNRSHVQRDTR